ncbi:MAG: glycosyltransferase family 4 protein [Candidatus Thermoplasmatota archaeon]|nr:glycosyltransferase family 4 protein [Candidatus Thermoplasmatota archaeon]MBU4256644.1 glycosyltransferase family 4 protein [Candidatus Thermoplasmatota archaeon]MCG2827368.1 glycosyltransferase family 4 protein [Thermoplasmatales archaeon]
MKTILFVYPGRFTFVKRDRKILEKHFKVIPFYATKNILKTLIQLASNIRNTDLFFIWFAGWHAFLSVLFANIFKKKSIVIVGGYDAAYVPEISYGVFTSWWRRLLANFVYKHSSKILVVDESLKNDILANTNLRIEQKIVAVPTGYDYEKYRPKGNKDRRLVITVGNVTKNVVKRKGFETFVKAAKYLPNINFVLIGRHIDDSVNSLKSIATPNVKFTDFVSDDELLGYYQKVAVYCQLSRYEGLPNALCEAMLCECVPVGTKYCGIPTAIGETGFYTPYNEPEATADAIKKALASPEKGEMARERIISMFPVREREKRLIKIINKLTEKGERK